MQTDKPPKILDVRPSIEYEICQLPGSENIPLKELLRSPENVVEVGSNEDMYIVCRLGNDSQIAAETLRTVNKNVIVKDMIGGLRGWSTYVDPQFPIY